MTGEWESAMVFFELFQSLYNRQESCPKGNVPFWYNSLHPVFFERPDSGINHRSNQGTPMTPWKLFKYSSNPSFRTLTRTATRASQWTICSTTHWAYCASIVRISNDEGRRPHRPIRRHSASVHWFFSRAPPVRSTGDCTSNLLNQPLPNKIGNQMKPMKTFLLLTLSLTALAASVPAKAQACQPQQLTCRAQRLVSQYKQQCQGAKRVLRAVHGSKRWPAQDRTERRATLATLESWVASNPKVCRYGGTLVSN